MRSLGSKLVCSIVSCAAVALLSCAPIVRESDNGDWAFAREVIPILYGRKARGYEELKVIVDMTRTVGREATLRGMMDRSEFVDHWTEVLFNHMQASKEAPFGSGAAEEDHQSQRQCFPQAVNPTGRAPDVARWIRDASPTAGAALCPGPAILCGTFTMTDVVRSSLLLDDLSPAYRAYLFALQNKPIDGNQTTPANRRSSLYRRFESVYLHRRNECLACHNSFTSVTNATSGWDRWHPLPGYLEEPIYGGHTGRQNDTELHAMFRVEGVNVSVGGGGIEPWGMSSCGTFRAPTTDDSAEGAAAFGFFIQSFGKRGSIFDIDAQFDSGVRALRDGMGRCQASLAGAGATCSTCTSSVEPPLTPSQRNAEDNVRTLLDGKGCFGASCHGGGAGGLTMTAANFKTNLVRAPSTGDATKARVAPGCADGTEAGCGGKGSHLIERLTTSDPLRRMPPGGQLTASEISTVRSWINGLPTDAGCGSSYCTASVACASYLFINPYVAGTEAFAYLAAASIVNAVWTQVMGSPLTIDLYHPRNDPQRNLLWNLTEFNFISTHWSLRELLVRILLFDYFNRKPPVSGDGPSAYELPQFFNPWAEGDPRYPPIARPGWVRGGPAPTPDPAYRKDAEANRPRHYDPMTEAVHRYSARSLLISTSTALDWPRPDRFYTAAYPGKELALVLGEYWKDVEPGFRGTSFGGLLTWEYKHGTCAKPDAMATDWIDRLMAEIPNFDAAHPAAPALIEDVARTVKDWLVNYSKLDGPVVDGTTINERQAVEAVFGTAFTTVASTVPDLATKTRNYCGMLLQSPQFMLVGLEPPLGPGPGPRPRLRVCNNTSCSFNAICREYSGSISRYSRPITCIGDVIVDQPRIGESGRWRELAVAVCSRASCIAMALPQGCVPGQKCALPPVCDPTIDGCGGPFSPIELAHQLRLGKVLAIPIDDAVVSDLLDNEGAQHLRAGERVGKGAPAQIGDWIHFAPDARIKVGFRSVLAPAPDEAARAGLTVVLVERSGQSFARARMPTYAPPIDEIRTLQQSPQRRFGSGGAPVDPRHNRFDPKQLEDRQRRSTEKRN